MLLLTSILVIWIAAVLAQWLHRILGARSGWLLAFVPVCVFAGFFYSLWQEPLRETFTWYAQLGATGDMKLDGLSRLMALLITGIGALIVLYASGYMGKHPQYGRFNCMLLLFMGSMLGVVLADSLILLFIFWELTSITSYLLIGFNHEELKARKKSLQALIVTGGGGLALLAGLVLMGQVTGEWTVSGVIATGDQLREHAWYPAILTLVLLGAFTKSAQFPFHFWLPNAMAGPTPVSAYLHSATMVKAGVYLLAILSPVLAGTLAWEYSLLIAGGITFLLGAIRGAFQTDLKSVLAYTTLSVLGLLVLLLGLDFKLAAQSMVLFLLGHALYKGALFMVVGIIDHETGTREAPQLRNLRKALPITAVAALLAALSSGGFPPFFGFLGKEYVFKTGLAVGGYGMVVLAIAVIGNAALLALAFKVGLHPFWSKGEADLPKKPHEAPFSMWIGPLLLGSVGLLLGLFPATLERPLVEPAVGAIMNMEVELKLALWHGFNLPLLLSVVTVSLGLTFYSFRSVFWRMAREGKLPKVIEADRVYEMWLNGVLAFAGWQTRVLQSGKLRNYLLIILGTVSVLLIWKLGSIPMQIYSGAYQPVPIYMLALLLLMMAATILVLMTNSKTAALIGFGIVGFGISLIFAYFGAPDLAITQIVVETLTLVLLFFIISRIPDLQQISNRATVIFDACFAMVAGVVTVILVLKTDLMQLAPSISDQFREWSYPLAKGKNIVNVILVDFRALDTYGEVIVLVIAALGVGILMRQKGEKS